MKSYICKSCGAELLLNDNTSFTTCLYCGNNIAITDKEIGKLNIKKIIQFEIEKDDAINIFNEIIKKDIIDAKKVYVPIRFCNYEFIFYMSYHYSSDDGPSRDLEELVEGKVKNDIIFNDGKINSIYLQYELRNKERLNFDPVLLNDVSIEYSLSDNIDILKKKIEKNIVLYFDNKLKHKPDIHVYATNYFLSDIEIEPFSTLIPVYILKTKNGEIYNIPGVRPYNYSIKNKKFKWFVTNSIILVFGLLLILFYNVEYSTETILLFLFILLCLTTPFIAVLFWKNKYIDMKYDNFSCKRYVYDKKNKKYK